MTAPHAPTAASAAHRAEAPERSRARLSRARSLACALAWLAAACANATSAPEPAIPSDAGALADAFARDREWLLDRISARREEEPPRDASADDAELREVARRMPALQEALARASAAPATSRP